MEMAEIREVVAEILADIDKNSISCTYRKYETFLERVGMLARRNPDELKRFDYQFKKLGIALFLGREEMRSIWDFKKGETVTFRPLRATGIASKKLETVGSPVPTVETRTVKVKHAGTVQVHSDESGISLYKHQEDAIKILQEKIVKTQATPFAGLLVLPTGGGKTLTSAYWLAKNFLNQNKKILWIAHRHELLEQAKATFQERIAYRDILPNRSSFNYRIISGIHDRPVNIKPTDDIIFSSKDSLAAGFEHLQNNWLKNDMREVFLVIDEAHHATAKTYRRLIDKLKESVDHFRMLGLTATPFRTLREENSLLKKVFPDDIVYKTDLTTLIIAGILSEPVFEEEKTNYDMTSVLDEKQLAKIKHFDFESIGKATAKTIAENDKRNWVIVNKYLKNRERYGQTLVFALNQDNAIALTKLFEIADVKADYVISSVRDMVTGAVISSKENKEKIDKFRRGEIEVLINVNILTEGTDLPKVQSVFLTRPTISPVLMTQMVGRGLRGEKAGGTKKAFIVSFVDDWKDQVAWSNPEKILIEENIDFDDRKIENQKRLIRLVSINKIEEFAILMNKFLDPESKNALEQLDFIARVPVGFFHFSVLNKVDGNGDEEREKNCEVLIYDNVRSSYEDFIASLPGFFEVSKLMKKDELSESLLETLCAKVEEQYFLGCPKYPAYYRQDIKDVLQYYAQTQTPPKFIELQNRDKYDVTDVAKEILMRDFRKQEEETFKTTAWESGEVEWKAFFGYDKRYFLNEIDLAVRKLTHPDLYKKPSSLPVDENEIRSIEKLSMGELREVLPEVWKQLSDEIYSRAKDKDGFYASASGNFKSRSKLDFQIDHIKPIKNGGLTRIDNLQLLTRSENVVKGSKAG